MGALAPISPWIPEDDLLLKNAVEAGASLEALAKGAVRFSRRFTIQELQNRWHALLYDPDTSGPASACMVELEHSASNLSSQSNRLGDSKGNGVPGKRKEESVRSHYYAMRKRIRNEPFNNVDLSFLVAPNIHNCTGIEGGCQEQLTVNNEHPVGNCMIGDPVADHFDLHGTDFGIVHHGFPQVVGADTAAGCNEGAAHAYHGGHRDSHESELPDGIIGRNCLYEFSENVPRLSVNDAIGSDMPHSFEHDNMHKGIPNVIGENLSVFDTHSGVQGMGPPQALSSGCLFETSDLTTKSLAGFDPVDNNPGTLCSGFGGSQGFCSPVSDCGASFHQLEYSSPAPTMPIWRTIEDMSTPTISTNENLDNNDKGGGATMVCPVGDAKQVTSSGYDLVQTEPQLEERMSSDGLKTSRDISEGDFLELSNTLLNFTNEEVLLFMDVDGKDLMDRSCLDGLSSILLGSPNDVHQDNIPSITEPKTSVALDVCLVVPNVTCSGELDVLGDKLPSGYKACDSNISVPSSTLAPNPHSPECRNGVICCTLNTEDPDIPCNDDVPSPTQVLPPFVPSVMQHTSEEDGKSFPPSTNDFSFNRKASEQGLNYAKEEEFLVASQMTESQLLPDMCSNNPINVCRITSELPGSVPLDVASSHIGTDVGEPSQCRSVQLTPYSISAGELKEETAKVDAGQHCEFASSIEFLLESSIHGSDQIRNLPQNNVNGYKQEADVPVAIQNHVSTHAEDGSFEMSFLEPVVNPSISDQEVQYSENDADIPYFSDIEAMILDMDLGPLDQDSYFNREVARYQCEEAKRAIIRLEQGSNSYMQRAIASHRAFAILYGRRLKHYIKKPEVSLGRATDDVSVDIDLAKEGRANKISRRQAIIKMEEDGSFCLKNLGKGSILVNGKEVATGHCIKLGSGCLIEIRSMRFIFETNQKVVKQYLANTAKKNQDKGSKFEWSAEGVS